MIVDYSGLRPNPTQWRPWHCNVDLQNAATLGAYVRIGSHHDLLTCIVTIDLMDEWGAGHWLHLSVARKRRLPTWEDLQHARDELGFGARMFVQLLPPIDHWINLHNYCLHLFSRLDADTVPVALWQGEGCDGAFYGKPGPLPGLSARTVRHG